MNLIDQAPHFDRTFTDWFADPEVLTWTRSWDGTLQLQKPAHGPGSRVSVVPSATMAY